MLRVSLVILCLLFLPSSNTLAQFDSNANASSWKRVGTNVTLINLGDKAGIGVEDPDAKLEVNGFTMLGSDAPKIKMKKLTGTSPAVGASGTIAHGLDKSKIIGAQVLVLGNNGNPIPPNFTSVGGYEFEFFIDATNAVIYCIAANSANIDGNAVTVLITYEE